LGAASLSARSHYRLDRATAVRSRALGEALRGRRRPGDCSIARPPLDDALDRLDPLDDGSIARLRLDRARQRLDNGSTCSIARPLDRLDAGSGAAGEARRPLGARIEGLIAGSGEGADRLGGIRSKSEPLAKPLPAVVRWIEGAGMAPMHLAYKPEHAVDLDTGVVVAAPIHPAEGDTASLALALAVEARQVLRARRLDPALLRHPRQHRAEASPLSRRMIVRSAGLASIVEPSTARRASLAVVRNS
jgi:hypothetical protein